MTAYLRPDSLEHALALRAEHPDFLLLAGGTDLMVGAGARAAPKGVIDLFRLPSLTGVEERDGDLWIGPSTTYTELIESTVINRRVPVLRQVSREIGAVQIQNRGTIGGNIGTSSPVGDTLPVLLALDATIELATLGHERGIAYRDFCTGYRQTALGPDEIITGVRVPMPSKDETHGYRKVGTRRAQAISKVLLATRHLVDDSGHFRQVRVAVGAMADRPVRVAALEELLEGRSPSSSLGDEAAAVVRSALRPIDDVRSTARYRTAVTANLVRAWVGQPNREG